MNMDFSCSLGNPRKLPCFFVGQCEPVRRFKISKSRFEHLLKVCYYVQSCSASAAIIYFSLGRNCRQQYGSGKFFLEGDFDWLNHTKIN